MACVTPITLKKEGLNGPLFINVPCGRCGFCQESRRNQWTFRNKIEHKHAHSSQWLTLTYSDENLEYGSTDQPILSKRDVQLFIKLLRKQNKRKWEHQLRYYCVGEYGTTTKRPHYHILMYNLHPSLYPKIQSIWKKGHVYMAQITDADIHYTTKHHVNRDYKNEYEVPEFCLMSKRPAIGYQYIQDNAEIHQENKHTFVYDNGHKTLMPRYYKDKIFDKEQKYMITSKSYEQTLDKNAKTDQYLKSKGFQNPENERFQRSINNAKKVKHKANKNDKF